MATSEIFLKINGKVLQAHYQLLEQSLNAQALAGALFSKRLITHQTIGELALPNTTTIQKNRILLQHLMGNSTPDLIPTLCEILNEQNTTQSQYLASTLKETFKREKDKIAAGSQAFHGNQHQKQAAPPQQQQPLQNDPMNKEPFVNDRNMTEEMLNQEFTEKKKEIKPLGTVKTKEGLVQKVVKLEDYEYLIEVVNDIEFMTAICEMEGEIYECVVCDDLTEVDTTYWYGKWKKVPVVVVQTGKQVGAQFQFGSWFETKKALCYMPQIKYVFGVGVCGAAVDVDDSGIEKPRVPKGHVVVSSHIIGYDHQKKAEHDQNRSFFSNCCENKFYRFLTQTANKHEWDKGLKFGRVLSGSWLIANIEAQKSLLDFYRKDEIAFEMEGVGIAAACQNKKNVECCLVIKGVSDYANRQKNDGWQPAAARNAACYLSDMINKKARVDNEP